MQKLRRKSLKLLSNRTELKLDTIHLIYFSPAFTVVPIIKQNSVISWRHINFYGEYDFTVLNEKGYNEIFNLEKIRKLKIS